MDFGFGISEKSSVSFKADGILTLESPHSTCSADLAKTAREGDARPTAIAWINGEKHGMVPSTGLKGLTRRMGYNAMVREEVKRTGNSHPYTLEDAYFNILGGIKNKGANKNNSLLDYEEWRALNPHMSLFGSGDAGHLNFVSANLVMGNAISVDPIREQVFSGARKSLSNDEMALLSEEELTKLYAAVDDNKEASEAKKKIADFEKKINAASKKGDTDIVESLKAKLAEYQESVEADLSKNSVNRPLAGWKALPQGTVLDHQMWLFRSNVAELGVLLHALNDLALESPFLGAHRTNGNGLVSAEWDFYLIGHKYDEPLFVGKVIMTPAHKLELTTDFLKNVFDFFSSAMASGAFNLHVPFDTKKGSQVTSDEEADEGVEA